MPLSQHLVKRRCPDSLVSVCDLFPPVLCDHKGFKEIVWHFGK